MPRKPFVFDKGIVQAQVYMNFDGLEAEYDKILERYRYQLKRDQKNMSEQRLQELHAETKQAAFDVQKKYIQKAKDQLERVKREHQDEYDPKPEPSNAYTVEAKLLHEMQRNNKLALFNAKMSTSTLSELEDMYYDNHYDEDFQALFEAELRKRQEKNGSAVEVVRNKIAINPVENAFKPFETELNAIESVVNGGHGLKNLSTKGVSGMEQFNIDKDIGPVPTNMTNQINRGW